MKRSIARSRMLVTGASSGIGRALAELAARSGARVMLVARSNDAINHLANSLTEEGCEVRAHCADVTSDQARCQIIDAVVNQLGGLDILVNNAGVLATGHFSEASPERLRLIMETNFFAAAELMRRAIPLLRNSDNATIVNIASVTGRRGVPARPEYRQS